MTILEHSIEVNVPVSAAFVRGPELAELTNDVARSAPREPGPMRIEISYEALAGGELAPKLAFCWGDAVRGRGRVTFSSSRASTGATRISIELEWPEDAGDRAGALYARARIDQALERYRLRLEPVLEPVGAAAT
jgi:hypothetical protein